MGINEDALSDVRRKVSEVLNKEDKRLVFGWRPEPEKKREDGEKWTDSSGKQWEMRSGIRQTVSKLQDAKTLWWCPKCSKPLNHKKDVQFWRLRGHCVDCQVQFEMKLRREGKLDEHVRNSVLRSFIAEARDKVKELQEYHDNLSKPEYINADDRQLLMTERWDVDIDRIKADLRLDIEKLQAKITETIEEHGTGE